MASPGSGRKKAHWHIGWPEQGRTRQRVCMCVCVRACARARSHVRMYRTTKPGAIHIYIMTSGQSGLADRVLLSPSSSVEIHRVLSAREKQDKREEKSERRLCSFTPPSLVSIVRPAVPFLPFLPLSLRLLFVQQQPLERPLFERRDGSRRKKNIQADFD